MIGIQTTGACQTRNVDGLPNRRTPGLKMRMPAKNRNNRNATTAMAAPKQSITSGTEPKAACNAVITSGKDATTYEYRRFDLSSMCELQIIVSVTV